MFDSMPVDKCMVPDYLPNYLNHVEDIVLLKAYQLHDHYILESFSNFLSQLILLASSKPDNEERSSP